MLDSAPDELPRYFHPLSPGALFRVVVFNAVLEKDLFIFGNANNPTTYERPRLVGRAREEEDKEERDANGEQPFN